MNSVEMAFNTSRSSLVFLFAVTLSWTLRDLQFPVPLLKGFLSFCLTRGSEHPAGKGKKELFQYSGKQNKDWAIPFTKNTILLQAELARDMSSCGKKMQPMLLLSIRFCLCPLPHSTPSHTPPPTASPGLNTPAVISLWLSGNRVAPMADGGLAAGQGKAGPDMTQGH